MRIVPDQENENQQIDVDRDEQSDSEAFDDRSEGVSDFKSNHYQIIFTSQFDSNQYIYFSLKICRPSLQSKRKTKHRLKLIN